MKLVAKAVESIGKQAPPVVNVDAPVVNVAAPAPAKKGKRKGKEPTEGDYATGSSNPVVKGVPGDHQSDEPVSRYSDPDGEVKTSMLDALRRTVAKADENPQQ